MVLNQTTFISAITKSYDPFLASDDLVKELCKVISSRFMIRLTDDKLDNKLMLLATFTIISDVLKAL